MDGGNVALLTREAREAQALADAAMGADWTRPAQPLHVPRRGEI